jgi:hypothetical protein
MPRLLPEVLEGKLVSKLHDRLSALLKWPNSAFILH